MSSRKRRETVLDLSGSERAELPDREVPVESPTFRETIRTVFGLNERDLATLSTIQHEPGVTTAELAERIDRDRSNVTRSLTTLREIGLVTRRRRIIESGGFFYEHYAEPPEDVERLLTTAVERWAHDAVDSVSAFEWTPGGDGKTPTAND